MLTDNTEAIKPLRFQVTVHPIMTNPSRAEDKERVRRAVQGDFDAFDQLVTQTEARVYSHLLRMVANPDDAKDLLQETYLSAFKNLKSFQGNSSFYTWVYRISTNHALMMFRKRRPEVSFDELPIPTHEELKKRNISDWAMDPAKAAHRQEVREILDKAITELPLPYRAVVVMRDVEGLSTAETAANLEIQEGAVKTRLHRARLALREILSKHFGPEELAALEEQSSE